MPTGRSLSFFNAVSDQPAVLMVFDRVRRTIGRKGHPWRVSPGPAFGFAVHVVDDRLDPGDEHQPPPITTRHQ